jgi:hypothetical protein
LATAAILRDLSKQRIAYVGAQRLRSRTLALPYQKQILAPAKLLLFKNAQSVKKLAGFMPADLLIFDLIKTIGLLSQG